MWTCSRMEVGTWWGPEGRNKMTEHQYPMFKADPNRGNGDNSADLGWDIQQLSQTPFSSRVVLSKCWWGSHTEWLVELTLWHQVNPVWAPGSVALHLWRGSASYPLSLNFLTCTMGLKKNIHLVELRWKLWFECQDPSGVLRPSRGFDKQSFYYYHVLGMVPSCLRWHWDKKPLDMGLVFKCDVEGSLLWFHSLWPQVTAAGLTTVERNSLWSYFRWVFCTWRG